MLKILSSILRFGPALAFMLGAVYLVSQPLLAAFPASPLAWQLNIALSPVMSDPMHLLFKIPGMGFWTAVLILSLMGVSGLFLARSRRKLVRAEFIYAHVAMMALLPGMWATAGKQVALSGAYLPNILDGDMAFLPSISSPLAFAIFLVVLAACLPLHAHVIRRMRLQRRHPVRAI